MRSTLTSMRCRNRQPDDDLTTWARAYAASPVITVEGRRKRHIVRALLTEVRAGR